MNSVTMHFCCNSDEIPDNNDNVKCFTSNPLGEIFKYSLTSLEFKITFTLSMSTLVYEKGRSGIKTEKKKFLTYVVSQIRR